MKAANPLLLTIMMAAVALAGCSDDPATGEFSSSSSGLKVDGSIDFAFQAREVPEAAGQQAPDEYCTLAEGAPEGTLPKCIPASTDVTVHLMDVTDPGPGNSYNVVLIANGTVFKDLGTAALVDGMFELTAHFDEDLEGRFTEVQIRFGEFPLATASPSGGAFDVNSMARATFEGSYTGKDLSLTVTGLLDGISYTGWLVVIDEETGEKTHEESFSVAEGENIYTAERSIDQYSEVHIHVGSSTINVAYTAL